MFRKFIHLSYLLIYLVVQSKGKYVEGEIHTSENWIFVARFCFLSEDGQFEFYIEYNEEYGEPNLLLYYDDEDQWPAVYKTNKTCAEKEGVLKTEQNQVLNLTGRNPFREVAGCLVKSTSIPQEERTTQRPRYTVVMPTFATRRGNSTKIQTNPPFETSTISTTVDNESTTILGYNYSTESTIALSADININLDINQENVTTPIDVELTSLSKPKVKKRSVSSFQTEYKPRGNRDVICRNARRFRTARERWWFIAISNCKGSKGIHVKYKFLMTNGPNGDYWHEHFSADEFYVLPVLMAFSVAYSFLILAIVICSIELKSRQLLHTTYKLFVFSVIIQFFGILFKSMAFLKYAVNGVGAPKLKLFGAMFMGISETCFLLLLLLLAKGYTVTRGRLPLAAGIKLTIFMCLYVVTYISLFIYEAKVFDPGDVLYTYESPAGYGLIILRIVAWCMFIYSTVFTLKHYPEKANFYYPFNVFGTLWFIAGPAFIISANTYIDKWVRESVVCAVLLFIAFGGHLMFLLLTMPSVANKNFPYHVRTTQIGVMEIAGNAGNSTIEQFGHHVYEPTSNMEQTVIIPLTRRTEEIFGGLYTQQMHAAIRSSRRNMEDDLDRRTLRNGTDIVMQNVLSWSLAKNFSTLDVAQFDKVVNSNIGSARSHRSEINETVPQTLTDGMEVVEAQTSQNNLEDWVREVPVELFTISKMVVTKTSPRLIDRSDK